MERAFPYDRERGMTLRDYFAATAIAGLMLDSDCVTAKDRAPFATAAYGLADAMLEARKPEGQG